MGDQDHTPLPAALLARQQSRIWGWMFTVKAGVARRRSGVSARRTARWQWPTRCRMPPASDAGYWHQSCSGAGNTRPPASSSTLRFFASNPQVRGDPAAFRSVGARSSEPVTRVIRGPGIPKKKPPRGDRAREVCADVRRQGFKQVLPVKHNAAGKFPSSPPAADGAPERSRSCRRGFRRQMPRV